MICCGSTGSIAWPGGKEANGFAANGASGGSSEDDGKAADLEAGLGAAEFSGSDMASSDIGSDDELLDASDGSDDDAAAAGVNRAARISPIVCSVVFADVPARQLKPGFRAGSVLAAARHAVSDWQH